MDADAKKNLIELLLSHRGALFFAVVPAAAWPDERLRLELARANFVAVRMARGVCYSVISDQELQHIELRLRFRAPTTGPMTLHALLDVQGDDQAEASEEWSAALNLATYRERTR